jgi:hypothetical protein
MMRSAKSKAAGVFHLMKGHLVAGNIALAVGMQDMGR